MNPVQLFKPTFGISEKLAVAQALESGWVGIGPRMLEFETKFAKHLGVKYAVMTNSCTSALHLALILRGIGRYATDGSIRNGPGHKVAVPTMTFCSTAHVVKHVGAEPILQDIDESSLLMAWQTKEEHQYDCWMPVLYAGQPCQPPEYFGNKPVIYDCAHAVGSAFDARNKLCCWSFHAVKNLACGEGGMLTTDDEELYQRALKLRWMGINKDTYQRSSEASRENNYKWEYDVEEIGYKYHGNDILASIGLTQLSKLDQMQERRRQIWHRYRAELNTIDWLPGHSNLLAVLRHKRRDELMEHLRNNGIGSGCHYRPLHLMSCYKEQAHNCPVADRIWSELITLPLHPEMTSADQTRVIEAVKSF